VLLDLSLGVEQGWEIFHALKKAHPNLPIVVTSARSDELTHSSASKASGVLEKPFDMPVLLNLIERITDPAVTTLESSDRKPIKNRF